MLSVPTSEQQTKSKYDDARREEERLRKLMFSEDATEFLSELKGCGLEDCEVLMLARAYGCDAGMWSYVLNHMLEKGALQPFDIEDLLNEQTLREICDVLSANGYIKEFGESMEEIDWFIANCYENSTFINKYTGPRLRGFFDWRCRRYARNRRDSPITRIYEFNQHYIEYNGNSAAMQRAVREYLETNLDHVSYETWVCAVYGMEGPDEEDYLAMKDAIAPYLDTVVEFLMLEYVSKREFAEII